MNISRGSVYYEPEPIGDDDLKLMPRIDELHLELPFARARMLRDLLRPEVWTRGDRRYCFAMATLRSERRAASTLFPDAIRRRANFKSRAEPGPNADLTLSPSR